MVVSAGRDVLGAEVSSVEALPEHGVYTVFVKLDNTKLELLHPLGDDSPIQVGGTQWLASLMHVVFLYPCAPTCNSAYLL